jgi:hypothetical protein
MVKEAVQQLGGECSYPAIKAKIRAAYGEGVNDSSVTCSIISGSVNHPSRIHYNENKKPRLSDTEYDYLFNTGRGKVVWHEPDKQGVWEIIKSTDGGLGVRLVEGVGEDNGPETETVDAASEGYGIFALEAHLRDYLARNLPKLDHLDTPLSLYKTQDRDGVEFQTDVGPIDILATGNGDFYVFELKLARGPDSALGQILRYMGWVKKHLAGSNMVFGIIVASDISEKLRYAATQVPNVRLMEYELKVDLHAVSLGG